MKRFLYIFRSGPYGSNAGQEGLDAVLAATALELEVSVAFVDDGVFLLKKDQTPTPGIKAYTKAFRALADLGVETMLVDRDSLSARGLQMNDLFLAAIESDVSALKSQIATHQRILVF